MPRRANRTCTGGATTRFQLSLAPTTLASLKKAIETACNVPAARAARMTRGRAAAAALLKGTRTRVVDAKAESVKISVVRYSVRPHLDLVPLPQLLPRPLPRRQPPALRFSQQRAVNLSPPSTALTSGPLAKKKRPSGRSNWPKTKADRDAWMARRAARAARGEPVGRAALVAARRQAEAQAAARATLPPTGLSSEHAVLARGRRATPPRRGCDYPPPAGVDRLLSPLLPSVGSISLSSRCPIIHTSVITLQGPFSFSDRVSSTLILRPWNSR